MISPWKQLPLRIRVRFSASTQTFLHTFCYEVLTINHTLIESTRWEIGPLVSKRRFDCPVWINLGLTGLKKVDWYHFHAIWHLEFPITCGIPKFPNSTKCVLDSWDYLWRPWLSSSFAYFWFLVPTTLEERVRNKTFFVFCLVPFYALISHFVDHISGY